MWSRYWVAIAQPSRPTIAVAIAAIMTMLLINARELDTLVAHEIAIPVNSITGFALALTDGAATSPEQNAEAGTAIKTETRRLAELLADLRELTRLDLTDGVRLEPVALEELALELAGRFRPAAAAADITLDVDVRPGTITTNARLLEMIASNLRVATRWALPHIGRCWWPRRSSGWPPGT